MAARDNEQVLYTVGQRHGNDGVLVRRSGRRYTDLVNGLFPCTDIALKLPRSFVRRSTLSYAAAAAVDEDDDDDSWSTSFSRQRYDPHRMQTLKYTRCVHDTPCKLCSSCKSSTLSSNSTYSICCGFVVDFQFSWVRVLN